MNKTEALNKIEELKDYIDNYINKGRWKPKDGDKYYYITYNGEIESSKYEVDLKAGHILAFRMGNCYQSEEKAEAVVALNNHIYSFPIPKKVTSFWCLYHMSDGKRNDLEPEFHEEKCSSGYTFEMKDRAMFLSGLYMSPCSTKKDRKERIKLLKKVYERS